LTLVVESAVGYRILLDPRDGEETVHGIGSEVMGFVDGFGDTLDMRMDICRYTVSALRPLRTMQSLHNSVSDNGYAAVQVKVLITIHKNSTIPSGKIIIPFPLDLQLSALLVASNALPQRLALRAVA
jgi:hypothetical protein